MVEHRTENMRILAVDDEQQVRELYEEFLSSPTSNYTFDLTLCHQGEEAVEAVRMATEEKKPFALAFIDIRMGSGKDGVWAAEQIRRMDPNIEIVIVTAYGDMTPEEIIPRVPPAGKLLYIRKPFSPEEIKQFATALCEKWQREVQLHKIHAELEHHVEEKTSDLTKTNKQLKREIEERKRAEEEIRNSEKRYRAVVEDMPAMICRFLPDATLTFVNGAYCSYFKKQREELLGENFFQFIPEQDQEKVRQHFLSLKPENPMVTYDHQVITPDGTICWQRWTDRALFDEQNTLVEYQSIGHDITEQKQAEEALRQSEKKYRTILENIEEGYFEVDLSGNFTFVNDSLCRIAGYPRDELIGMNNREYTSPETAKEMYEIFNRTYRTGEPARIVDYEIFRKDGSPRILQMSASLMKDSSGQSIGFMGVVRDVTERKKAEDALRQSEERFRTIFEKTAVGILIVDNKARKYIKVNPAFQLMSGYNGDELLSMGPNDIAHPEDWAREEVLLHELSSAKRDQYQIEKRYIRKDSELFWARVTVSMVHDVPTSQEYTVSVVEDITERKRAEEALRESEASLKSMLKAAPIGIGLVHDRVLSWASDKMEEMLGYPRHELMGSSARLAYETDEEFERVGRVKYEQIREKGIGEVETRWKRKDGSVIDVQLRSTPINPEDLSEGVTFTAVDITERKRAEEALRESEERFREMAENVREVFWLFDWKTQKVIYVSPAYEEIWGRSIEDLYKNYDEWAESVYPDDFEYARESFTKIVETGGGEPREYRIVRPDGTIRWVSDRGFAIRGEDGQVRRIAGIAEDITERYQAIEALRASEEKYRTVLEANPDPVVVYDIDGKVVYFNPAFTSVFGWSLGERLGKKMDLFVPEENWPETQMMIERVLAGESFSGIETRRYTKEEKIIPVSISGAILRDMDGNPVGSVINLRDISEQKNLESQLQHAQKMEAVGTLAGGIAHDFNNLLQAIQGYTELLLMRKKEGDAGFREMQEVIRASKRGAELTQQLLTFSRKVESKRKPLQLNQEVGELRELLERTIPKMIDVEFNLAPDLKMIKADSVQLKQVLMNLAVNAKDAMPEGGKLVIHTENRTLDQEFCKRYAEVKPGDYVMLSISDTGHGMDKETLEHIFDPFYTTKEVGKGTGLGLAIVYGIIKNHEGYVMCYSQPGKGSAFIIYLPASKSETEVVPMVDSPESKSLAVGGDETILLVDDEEFIRELGVDVLGQAGYTVLTASNGEQALEVYRREGDRIDLVILDLIMPGMGGGKCLEGLLKIDPQAQVLIASGYSPDASTKGALESGATGFINKPYDTRKLLQLVRKILDENVEVKSMARG